MLNFHAEATCGGRPVFGKPFIKLPLKHRSWFYPVIFINYIYSQGRNALINNMSSELDVILFCIVCLSDYHLLFIYPSIHPSIQLCTSWVYHIWTSSPSEAGAFQILEYLHICQTSWKWDWHLNESIYFMYTLSYSYLEVILYSIFSGLAFLLWPSCHMRPNVVFSTCGIMSELKNFQTLNALKISD